MKRYIDANKAKIKYSSKDVDNIANLFNELIDSQPTADVVEVIRCKDCRRRDEKVNGIMLCPIAWVKERTEDDDYCSYGERKE